MPSSPWWQSGARRPAAKARRFDVAQRRPERAEGRRVKISGICEREATQPAGMHRRPNAAGLPPRAARRAIDGAATVAAAALAAVLFGACASQKPDPADRPDNVPRSSRVEPAPTRPSSPVRAELLADVEIIQPGVLFRLGVLLVMQPGWHVHWTNPGASGEPTEIVLRLPDGFTAGPLQWPTPTLVMQPDGGRRVRVSRPGPRA